MKKCSTKIILLMVIILSFIILSPTYIQVKNVILFIPDGMSINALTLARWYNDGKLLTVDPLLCGLVRTYSSDSPIADSAPAATAFATGYKSHAGYISVMPDKADIAGYTLDIKDRELFPVLTVLEAAKIIRKSVGLVATSNIQHATPAAFSSHFPDRNNYEAIAEQQVYNMLDVVFAGGIKYLTGENRKDKEDLLGILKNNGYQVVFTPAELIKAKNTKVWGLFAEDSLAYDFDRDPEKEPSLAEMTKKAIELLSKNKDGFFLMVEGSKIDWALHANDPVGAISDILAFDRAVKTALDFAKKDKNTVVIVVSDHGTGGLTIGNADLNKGYDTSVLDQFIAPLKNCRYTASKIEQFFTPEMTPEDIIKVFADYTGINDLTDLELEAVTSYISSNKKGGFSYVFGPIISKRAYIGWTTTGHTGDDTPLFVYHPKNSVLSGVVENTDIAVYISALFGFNLERLNSYYFVEAESAFKALQAETTIDITDPENPVLTVKKGQTTLLIPANKNIVYVNGKIQTYTSLMVYNGKLFFVPRSVFYLLK